MREQFHRGAKTAFKVRWLEVDRELRDALVARIRPLVDYLAAELAAEALRRLQAEVDRMGEAFEVAVSAYVSASDVADVRGGGEPPRMAVPEPAVAAEQGSTSPPPAPQPSARRLKPTAAALELAKRNRESRDAPPRASDLLEQALGPEIAGMLAHPVQPEPEVAPRAPVPTETVAAQERIAARRNGPAREHAEVSALASPNLSMAAARAHIAARAEARAAERKALRHRRTQGSEPKDPNPNAEERWSTARIAEERELAEANKREGELPMPRSSWAF